MATAGTALVKILVLMITHEINSYITSTFNKYPYYTCISDLHSKTVAELCLSEKIYPKL